MKKRSSWRTTLGGFIGGGGLIVAETFPQWAKWGHLAAALGALLTGVAARDNGVTSEQAGAQTTPAAR